MIIPWTEVRVTGHFRLRLKQRAGITAPRLRQEALRLDRVILADDIPARTGSNPDAHSPAMYFHVPPFGVVVLMANFDETLPHTWDAITLLPYYPEP